MACGGQGGGQASAGLQEQGSCSAEQGHDSDESTRLLSMNLLFLRPLPLAVFYRFVLNVEGALPPSSVFGGWVDALLFWREKILIHCSFGSPTIYLSIYLN